MSSWCTIEIVLSLDEEVADADAGKNRVESDNIFRTSLLMMQQEVVGWLMPWFGWPGDDSMGEQRSSVVCFWNFDKFWRQWDFPASWRCYTLESITSELGNSRCPLPFAVRSDDEGCLTLFAFCLTKYDS